MVFFFLFSSSHLQDFIFFLVFSNLTMKCLHDFFFFSSLEFSEFLESVICCLALILENSQQLPVSLFCCCYCCYSLFLLRLQLPLLSNSYLILSNSCLILSNSFCCSVRPLSHIWLFETPWTVACQAPLSMEFSTQEYWIGLSSPSPRDPPNPGIELGSPALQADSLPSEPQWKLPCCSRLKKKQNKQKKNLVFSSCFSLDNSYEPISSSQSAISPL